MALFGLLASGAAPAQPVALSDPLEHIFQQLRTTASAEQVEQIRSAVRDSGPLATELNSLASTRSFTEIRVVPAGSMPANKKIFRACVDGSAIVLASELLPMLQRKRLLHVEYPGDILPDNTAFVLAHLAYHLRTAPQRTQLEAHMHQQVQEVMQLPGQPHDLTAIMKEYIDHKLDDEGAAFIQGWNATVAAAQNENHDVPLTVQQLADLLLNARYRFALINVTPADASVHYGPGGVVELNDDNVKVVAARLARASIPDIE